MENKTYKSPPVAILKRQASPGTIKSPGKPDMLSTCCGDRHAVFYCNSPRYNGSLWSTAVHNPVQSTVFLVHDALVYTVHLNTWLTLVHDLLQSTACSTRSCPQSILVHCTIHYSPLPCTIHTTIHSSCQSRIHSQFGPQSTPIQCIVHSPFQSTFHCSAL